MQDNLSATKTAASATAPAICPSCGRPNPENKKRCSYCCTLTSQDERISLRAMNLSTIILFIAAFIYFAIAVNLKPQYVPIAELDETKNFQHIRVLGKVGYVNEFKDKYNKRSTIQFDVIDQKNGEGDNYEGKIKVKAEGEVAKDLKDKGIIPSKGDVVDLSGALYAGKGYRILSLGSAELLKFIEKSPDSTPITVSIKELLEKPENYKDKKINIKEAVIKSRKGKLMIEAAEPADLSKTILLFGVNPDNYKDNQKISANGRFVYYERGGYWEVKISEDEPNSIVPLN